MTAAMLVLGPIFEADLPPEQYAYRAGRNAQQAVIDAEETLYRGHLDVVDADLADYFGSIPHADLMRSLARRIVDSRVLHLIKMWLECAVEETDDRGRKKRTTEARDSGRGIPQGSPISPLLANLYMRRFVLGWKKLGLEDSLGSRIVTYADDLVILCRRGRAEEALQRLREIMARLKLTVNEEKTRICKVPESEFDFLGYTFGRMYKRTTGQAYLGVRPSKKSIRRMVEKIHAMTAVSGTGQATTQLVEHVRIASPDLLPIGGRCLTVIVTGSNNLGGSDGEETHWIGTSGADCGGSRPVFDQRLVGEAGDSAGVRGNHRLPPKVGDPHLEREWGRQRGGDPTPATSSLRSRVLQHADRVVGGVRQGLWEATSSITAVARSGA
jgi:group II intron reverse transcriptase/maturase